MLHAQRSTSVARPNGGALSIFTWPSDEDLGGFVKANARRINERRWMNSTLHGPAGGDLDSCALFCVSILGLLLRCLVMMGRHSALHL